VSSLVPVKAPERGYGARPSGGTQAAESGKWLFAGYLTLLLVEYGGLAKVVPVLQAVRFSTVLSYGLFLVVLVKYGLGGLTGLRQTKLLFALIVFTVMSVIWAVVQWNAFNSIRPLVDYFILYVLTVRLVDRQRRADALSWVFLVTVVVLVARNIDKLSSPERTGAFAAPYFMGDGNDFAWSMVILLPIILNLAFGKRGVLTRLLSVCGIVACLVAVVGSGSRGAALGLAAALLYYWIVMSRHKALGAAAIVVLLVGTLVLAPPEYFERLETIGSYQQDSSAQGRLQVWGAAIRMAVEHPLGVGAGNFSSAYGRYYIPPASENALAWGSQRWLAAHSIYFKMLGEYGILGLLLLLSVIHANLRDNSASRGWLAAGRDQASFSPIWPALLNMSIVGYAVCGAFLGGISYPHLFVLSALTVSAKQASETQSAPPSSDRGIARAIA
jgi:probable O-glycosylation ligase (exosortase A-associated)